MACKAVIKPKPGYYARNFKIIDATGKDVSDIDFETGEVVKMWTEAELYCGKFWVPIYKYQPFIDYVENKFSFVNTTLISAQHNVIDQINGTEALSGDGLDTISDDEIPDEEQQLDFSSAGIEIGKEESEE